MEEEYQLEVFQFPTYKTKEETRMKNINQFFVPHFHGLTIEDQYTFLFEFEVLRKTYDY
jgi:hypothetical protein